MTPDDALKQIEAELAHPDRGWQYCIGGFATKLFMSGYLTAKMNVSIGFDMLIGECEMNPYPAIGLMYTIIQNSSTIKSETDPMLANFSNCLRQRGYLGVVDNLEDIGEEWRQGIFAEWYMMCGFILAKEGPINLRLLNKIVDAGALEELVAMLYSFTTIMQDEGLTLNASPEDIIQLYISCLS